MLQAVGAAVTHVSLDSGTCPSLSQRYIRTAQTPLSCAQYIPSTVVNDCFSTPPPALGTLP
eukprot:2329111-Alexandrium_andersonii.AAC.1